MTHFTNLSFKQLTDLWITHRTWTKASPWESLQEKAGNQLLNLVTNLQLQHAKLRKQQTYIEGFSIHWLASAKPNPTLPTLFLLHGLSGNSSNWLMFTPFLIKHFNLVIPDLPAHGASSYLPNAHYTSADQARRVFNLANYLKIDKFHVIGHSMGGMLAGFMAISEPQRLLSLSLFANAGLQSRQATTFELELNNGNNPFLIHSVAELIQFTGMVMHKVPFIPHPVSVALAKQSYRARKAVLHCMSDLIPDIFVHHTLRNQLHQTQVPTFVLWGKNDQINSIDIMHQIQENNPSARTVSLANVGHMPMMEAPRLCAKHYLSFIKTL